MEISQQGCPKCGESHYAVGSSTTTLAYYQPVYKNGVNINPDRNTINTTLHCKECGNTWEITSDCG